MIARPCRCWHLDSSAMATITEPAAGVHWRGGYGRLFSAAVLSRFGDAIRGVALPLVAAGLTTSPLILSMVSAAGYIPWLLFGLLGGALADRVDRRRAMWAVDVARGVLIGAFAISLAVGHTHIAALMALAFALTTMQTLFDNAATAILPALVGPSALTSANARLMTGQSLAGTFLGAPVAGLLAGAALALPFAVNAATYLVAAALIASLPRSVGQTTARPVGSTLRREIADGVRYLWRDRLLRGISLTNLLGNFVIGGLTALLVLIVTRWVGASGAVFGLVLAAYGAGATLGGLVASRISRRIGPIVSIAAALAAQTASLVVIGAVAHVAGTAAGLAVFGAAGMLVNVNGVTLTQQRTPAEALGRVSAAQRTLAIAGAPIGALLFGAIATATEVNVPALVGAGVMALAAITMAIASRLDTQQHEHGPARAS